MGVIYEGVKVLSVELPEEIKLWRVPSLAALGGTTLGVRDFGLYNRGLGDGSRFGITNGKLVPVPRDQIVRRRLERLTHFGNPVEAQNFKKACGL